jgi:hypothetical protein
MATERIEVEVIAITGEAVDNIDDLKDKIDDLNKAKEKSKDLDKEGQAATEGQAKIIRLFDKATGGAVTRVKNLVDGVKALVFEIRALTAAQLKANLAFLANPFAIAAIGIGAATAAFVGFVQYATDSALPALTTLKNTFLSLGNAQRFAALQGAALVTEQTKEQVSQVERAIAVLQAFGEETLNLEIENQERRLSLLKEGSDEYEAELTKLLILRAKRSREEGEKEAAAKEEGRQAKLKEIQEQEQFEADQRSLAAIQDEFDKGFLEEESYLAGKRAVYGELEETDPFFGFLDPNKDPELDPELQYSLALNDALIQVEKDKTEKIKAARQDLFLNLASIFGAETKLGKAFLVAKQLQVAAELAGEIRKTITFSQQSAARTATAAAEAIAVSSLAVAQGVAETAKVGFPKNIPLLIAYAAQAAGIISAIRQAVRGVPTAQAAFLPAQPGISPQIIQTLPNVSPVGRDSTSQLAEAIQSQQQRPIRAFVVSSDVTSAQELDRNIVEGASI